jgi:hypothetical protein
MKSFKDDCLDVLTWIVVAIAIMIAIIAAFIAIILGIYAGIAKPFNEIACNDRDTLDRVVHTDYKLWADTCYVTLENGTVVPADQYRVNKVINDE